MRRRDDPIAWRVSDAHPGLKAALAQLLGAPWQRCTVHFLRDLRGHARRDQHDALGAVIRSIFTAADGDEARRRLGDAVIQLQSRLSKVAALLEQSNREVARRNDVVGIFPDDPSLIRLVSMLAVEANDEWRPGPRRHSLPEQQEEETELAAA